MPFLFLCKKYLQSLFTSDVVAGMVMDDLLNKFSFRYTEGERGRARMVFTYFRSAWKHAWKPVLVESDGCIDGSPEVLVFDSRYEKKNRDRYLALLLPDRYLYLSRNVCYFDITLLQKIKLSVFLLILCPVLWIAALFRSNKANLGLLLVELVEVSLLEAQLNYFSSVRRIILFSAYEKDSCFQAAWLMQERKLSVQIVPSTNPLRNFYKKGICTIFTFTAAFHPEEFEVIRKDWVFAETINWPPFGYEEVLPLLPSYKKPTPLTIGYFSSGNWLREKLGHASWGANEREAERALLACLQQLLIDQPEFRLTIYLHPLEKRKVEHLDASRRFYHDLFGETISYAPLEFNSVTSFELVDIGVTVYSSTAFQRLFAGMKTLLAPFSMPTDYFLDQRLEAISIRQASDFERIVLGLTTMSQASFFKEYNLEPYSYRAFPQLCPIENQPVV